MVVTAEQLRVYIGAKENELDAVTLDLARAEGEITRALERAWRQPTEAERDGLVLEVGHELFKRRDSPSGSSQYADYSTGQPVAGPRDPLTPVWPMLRRFVTSF